MAIKKAIGHAPLKRNKVLLHAKARIRQTSVNLRKAPKLKAKVKQNRQLTIKRRNKIYLAYCQLMRRRGFSMTLDAARRLPFRLVMNTLNRAKAKKAARPRLVPKPKLLTKPWTKGKRRLARTSRRRQWKRLAPVQKKRKRTGPGAYASQAPQRNYQAVAATAVPMWDPGDINAPAPLIEEIHANNTEIPHLDHIFSQNTDPTIDPGLWSLVVGELPENYQIPDPAFTTSLAYARAEVLDPTQSSGDDILTPDTEL